jgi:nucleotide-binding universal stress UspA family protein
MDRKILLAVDDSRNSRLAAKYACELFVAEHNVYFDLLNVQPAVSDFLIEEAKRKAPARRKLDQLAQENATYSRKILSDFQALFKSEGIAEDRVGVHTLPRSLGVAKDILDFATQRRFDSILLGRRGMSGLQDMIFGSVSNNIIQQSQMVPVWMVDDRPTQGRVLVSVDGSSSSLRAIDHLAFILAARKDIRLVFFHVRPKLRHFCPIDFDDDSAARLEDVVTAGDTRCIDNFYGKARRRLSEAGIGEKQIEIKTRTGLNRVGNQIVDELSSGDYSTLVLGRSGGSRSHFMGSVALHVVSKVSGCAVWIVP